MSNSSPDLLSSNQCGVKGCKNTRDSGAFAGPFCAPCDHDLRTGNFEFGTSVVYEQARKIERAKRIMQRAISWLQIKEAAFTTHKGPAIIEEMQRYVGDLPVETTAMRSQEAFRLINAATYTCLVIESFIRTWLRGWEALHRPRHHRRNRHQIYALMECR